MKIILSNLNTYLNGRFRKCDIAVSEGRVIDISESIRKTDGFTVYKLNNCFCFPGFVDVHVHLREPGFSYKETIKTGTLAAAYGGYTTVCSMPNLNPVPDCYENLALQLDKIDKDAQIEVVPFGSITKGEKGEELSNFEEMSRFVAGFSDDGKGVQNEAVMREAMKRASALGKIISAHCEDNSLLNGSCVHDGAFSRRLGIKGISSESEYAQIERDLKLAKETGCKYHVCHISTKKAVELIDRAKKDGVDVSCETAPHYLVLCDEDMQNSGNFKMNPPLRTRADREALIEGICNGTIDMIATDHAPHSEEEKAGGVEKSCMGIVGLETAFPVLYTHLVKTGIISLERLVELMAVNPSRRFGFNCGIEVGSAAKLTVFNLEKEYVINSQNFHSMGKSTPFDGMSVYGEHKITVCGGRIYA